MDENDPFKGAPARKHLTTITRSSSLPTPNAKPRHGNKPSPLRNNNTFNVLESSSTKKRRKRKSKSSTPSSPQTPTLAMTPSEDETGQNNEEKRYQSEQVTRSRPTPAQIPAAAAATLPAAATIATAAEDERRSFSFWDYLRDEVTVSDFDTAQEIKRERVTNFLGVPAAVEKLMLFGFVVCLDSFLYTFTILPLRFYLALYHYGNHLYDNMRAVAKGRESRFVRLRPSQKCDLLKGFLIIITCCVMWTLDPSRIYHTIRGQAVLKLYVVFNVLEIFDKLCCSVGQDILDALFSKSTLGNPAQALGGAAYAKRQLRPITLFLLATVYMSIHTSVLFLQMITLNVAINFYSNALLSLLISNQFVEIKQAVFKKFEKENLFQLSCSDVVERFQQFAFLLIISLRNVIELSESSPSSILPSTFVPIFKLPATTTLNALMTPVLMVVASELLVDWLKHAFITKFNQIRPSIYEKYIDVLCKDLVIGSPGRTSGRRNAFVDQSPVVSRRIGFPALPLACLHVRMVQQLLPMMFAPHSSQSSSTGDITALTGFLLKTIGSVFPNQAASEWLEHGLDQGVRLLSQFIVLAILMVCLLALKVLVGINLLGHAYKRYASMTERDTAETEKDKQMKEMSKDEEVKRKKKEKSRTRLTACHNGGNLHILFLRSGYYLYSNITRAYGAICMTPPIA